VKRFIEKDLKVKDRKSKKLAPQITPKPLGSLLGGDQSESSFLSSRPEPATIGFVKSEHFTIPLT
jgi:hypothetical protein